MVGRFPHREVVVQVILQVITDRDRRGAQVFAIDLSEAMTARGHLVRTVALERGRSAEPLEVPHLGPSRLGLTTLRALRSEISSAEVVIGHGSTTLMACGLAATGTGVPVIYRQISDSLFWAPTLSRRLRVRAGMRRATAVVALWPGAAMTLESRFGVARRKLTVIPNGVPAARFDAITEQTRSDARRRLRIPVDAVVVVYVGALVAEKGVDTAIRAMELLTSAHLVIVGDGPKRAELEALAVSRCPGRVQFMGSVRSPLEAYEMADVLVLASRGGDSMPAVLIEAGLCEVPSVATPVQAIPQVVVPGVTGQLVPPDDPEALAAGLDDAISHRATYGPAARRHCLERFEISVVADAWLRVIREVSS